MRTVRLSPLLLAFCVGVSQASPIIVNGGKMSEPWHTAGLTMETDCILPGIVPNGVCSLLSALPSLFASGVSPTSTQMTASSSSTGARTLPSNSGSISSTNTFLSSTVTDPSSGQSTSVPGASLSPAQKPVSTGAAVAIGVSIAFFVCGLVLAFMVRRRRRQRQNMGRAPTTASPLMLARTSTGQEPVQTEATMVDLQNGNTRMSVHRGGSEADGLLAGIPRRSEPTPDAGARPPSVGDTLTSPAGDFKTSDVEAEIQVSREQLNGVPSRLSAQEVNHQSAGGPPEYV